MKTFIGNKAAQALVVVGALAAGAAGAQEFENHVKARQGQFWTLAINLGMLGDMAKGEAPYDAEAALEAAQSIEAVSAIHMATLFPEGSDNMSIDGTRAQATIWEDADDFAAKWAALGEAAQNAAAGAGDGQEALAPLMGQLGAACQDCHKAHRAPAN